MLARPVGAGAAMQFGDNPCELAVWCKVLRDKGWSGPRIARAIAKSEGYVNNLIRVVDRAAPAVLLRWRAESSDARLVRACATDWLVQVCLLPHADQEAALQHRLDRLSPRDHA